MPELEKETKKNELQLLIFKLGEEEFGIPIQQVREILRLQEIHHLPGSPDFIEGVINLRGHIIAVMDLRKRLGLSELREYTSTSRIIIVRIRDMNVGLIVDNVKEILALLQGNIDSTPALIRIQIPNTFLSGVGKIDERVIIILALEEVLTYIEAVKLSKAKSEYIKVK